MSEKVCRSLTNDRQCQNTALCGISLFFYGGYDYVSIATNIGGEQQGEQSCISDLQFSPTEAAPPWVLWTNKKRSIRTNVAQRFHLNNMTAPTPILEATASSALWATSSDFKWPVGTSSSGVSFSNTTRQTPSSSQGTTALNQPGANIENATSATHAAATATTSHRTAISIHPTISRAKPPGKSSDPALSDSISTRVVPLSDITAFRYSYHYYSSNDSLRSSISSILRIQRGSPIDLYVSLSTCVIR